MEHAGLAPNKQLIDVLGQELMELGLKLRKREVLPKFLMEGVAYLGSVRGIRVVPQNSQ